MFVWGGGGGRVLLCAQRQYYRRDKLDCPPQKGLNHYLPLNKTGGQVQVSERFRATMALLFFIVITFGLACVLGPLFP